MIEWLIDPLTHGFVLRSLAGIVLLGTVGGAIGCWIVLYRVAYSAESLAHGMFPGLVGATLLGLPLLLGGAVGILLAALLIVLIGRIGGESADVAIAVAVTTLFGLGVLMALSPESPPGIQSLLFGDPLAVSNRDLAVTAVLSSVVLVGLWRSHDRLSAIGFDGAFGRSLGLSPAAVQGLLLALVAVAVLVGVRGLGNLLVAAILVGPAATARLLTDRMAPMIGLSVTVAVLAGVFGIYLSFYARIAAGAAVVACLVGLYLIAAAASALRRSRSPRGPMESEPTALTEGAGP
ncbi:MAG: metal ABC transporter permease [Solirubrobacterales bacterium]|nr:metal ABC transporter permease [Solirubrobacterales bacterium]